MNVPSPNLTSLYASCPSSADINYTLAARCAPILRFDAREPFLPIAEADSIFRKNTLSPSFPRRIEVSEVERSRPDLYIWVSRWQHELSKRYNKPIDAEDAVEKFSEREDYDRD